MQNENCCGFLEDLDILGQSPIQKGQDSKVSRTIPRTFRIMTPRNSSKNSRVSLEIQFFS